MRDRPLLLDLFCGAGGCAVGYDRAGFEVVGVDTVRRRYPFRLHVADALEFVDRWGHKFDAVHASPPCQAYSVATAGYRSHGRAYVDLLARTRESLVRLGKPWVIENVPGAPMRGDIKLCGCMFGLRVIRQRYFETSWHHFDLMPSCLHEGEYISVVGNGTPLGTMKRTGRTFDTAEARRAMGIGWMSRRELSLAIPPAYTEYVGRALMDQVRSAVCS